MCKKRSKICLLDSGSGNSRPLAETVIHKDLSAIHPIVAAGHRGRLKEGVQHHTSSQTSNWPATVRGGSCHLKPLSPEARPIHFTNTFWDSERPNEERDSWPVLGGGQTRIHAPSWKTSTPSPGRWWRSSWGTGCPLRLSVPKTSPRLNEAEGFLGNAGRKRKQSGKGRAHESLRRTNPNREQEPT